MDEYEIMDYGERVATANYEAARREANDYVDPDEARVSLAMACPKCGEDRADHLIVTAHDARIECATCHTVYTVDAPAVHHCHCGAPLDDAGCECAICAAEWSDYLNERAEVLETL